MKIEFQNVVPVPLIDQNFNSDSIWNKQLILDSSSNHMVSSESGKGKSTFIHIIFGLRKDYNGEVILNGKNLKKFTPNDWASIRTDQLSILPQDTKLFSDLSVKENLLLKNQLTNYKSESEIKTLVEEFQLENKWNTPCGLLSFGQQQRIGIIRSILQPFEFILLDEPFSNIDDTNIEIAKSMIEKAASNTNGKIIIASLGHTYGWNFNKITL